MLSIFLFNNVSHNWFLEHEVIILFSLISRYEIPNKYLYISIYSGAYFRNIQILDPYILFNLS